LFIGRTFSGDCSVCGLNLQIGARLGVNDGDLMCAWANRVGR
jgi:hypothetical protein